MLDVDHFRAFNEEEGHDAGDFVLKKVAEKLKEAVRPYDLPARYGGEEFSAVLPGLDLRFSLEVAERVRKSIEQIEYVSANGRVRHVTASLGVSSYPETARDSGSLFKAADVALFKAKRAGRNRSFSYEGVFKDEGKSSDLDDTSWMEKWQTADDKPISEALWQYLKPYAGFIATSLILSKNQTTILENLIRIYPAYKRMMARNDPDLMRQLELAAEFRPLLPSLMTMHERFDGSGPMKMTGQKIPLLARVMAVLMALAEEKGAPLAQDAPRFDPEIVALVVNIREAA
jgi:diguanylate cyclase (GGDEF)-like protein